MANKRTLEELRAVYSEQDRSNREALPNNYYPFFGMKPGQKAIIRFLPDKDEDNIRGFLVEKVFHILVINGKKTMVPCLSMYDEQCPVCKVSTDYYNVKDEVNGKKYWRKKQYIAQVLVIEDPLPADDATGETHEGKVRYVALGWQLFSIIIDAIKSGEVKSIPYDFENGYDFVIKKTEQRQGEKVYPTYTIGSRFMDSPRSLSEEELAVVEDGMIELTSLLPRNPGFEKVKALLDADLNGEGVVEDESESEEIPETAARPHKTVATKAAKTVDEKPLKPVGKSPKKEEEDTSNSADMEDVDAMLEAIKARRNPGRTSK